ncbi:hypothetical protein ACFLS0_01180 [Candidatus Bipolaricaulota bacterium]
MPKIWVCAALLVLAAGVMGVAGEFTGRFTSVSEFEFDPFSLDWFETLVEIDYLQSGWTFGATALFVNDDFEFIFFDVEGCLGAINLRSVAGFDPFDYYAGSPLFEYWNSYATMTLAGVDLYAILLVSNQWYYDVYWDDWEDLPNEVGVGLRMGGWGSVGDVTLYGEVQFNVDSYGYEDGPYWIWAYGFENFAPVFLGHVNYEDWYGWSDWYWTDSEFTPHHPTCTLPWSGADFILLAPFTCFDLYVGLGFTCDMGFDYLDFFVEHIDLGLPWLEMAYIDLWFETDSKEVTWAFDFILADFVCIKPYLSLDTGTNGFSIDGVVLNALTLEYEVSPGIIFKAGEKFTEDEWLDYVTWTEQEWAGWTAWGEIAAWQDNLWEYGWDTVISDYSDYDEYLALEIAGDSCCGGQFDMFIYNWFDIEQTEAFMDWAETIAGLRLGIGSNTTLIFTLYVSIDGLEWIDVGMDFVW